MFRELVMFNSIHLKQEGAAMNLNIICEKYVPTERTAEGEYILRPPRYTVYAEDADHNYLFVFRSNGQTVTPQDLRFVHFNSERSRNSYSWVSTNDKMQRIMLRPCPLYADAANSSTATRKDIALIKRVIKAVTNVQIDFPTEDCAGLSHNTVTVSYQ